MSTYHFHAWLGWGLAVFSGFAVNIALEGSGRWFGGAVTAGIMSIYFFLREIAEFIASEIAREIKKDR